MPTCSFLLYGFGPSGFGKEENPLPLDTYNLLPTVFTQVGYQPVGINPLDTLEPGLLTSNTARQLLSALAIYSIRPFLLNAKPLLVDPLSCVGYSAVFSVSCTFLFCMSI